jgi:hypothetical protein
MKRNPKQAVAIHYQQALWILLLIGTFILSQCNGNLIPLFGR